MRAHDGGGGGHPEVAGEPDLARLVVVEFVPAVRRLSGDGLAALARDDAPPVDAPPHGVADRGELRSWCSWRMMLSPFSS